MGRKLVELRAGDRIPEGAKLVHTREGRGRLLGTRIIDQGFFNGGQHRVYDYESVPVFVYEVEEQAPKVTNADK